MFFYEIPDGRIKNCPPNQERYRKFRMFTEEVNQLPKESDFYDGIFIWRDEENKTTEVYVDGNKLATKADSISSITLNGQKFTPGPNGTIDLTGIVADKKSVDRKQDKLTAGNGITIDNNVISATGLKEGDVIATQKDLESGLAGKQDKFFNVLDPDGSIFVDDEGNLKINPNSGYKVAYREGPGIAIEPGYEVPNSRMVRVKHDSTIKVNDKGELHVDVLELPTEQPIAYDLETNKLTLLYDPKTLHITDEGSLAVNEDLGMIYKTFGYSQEAVEFPLVTIPYVRDDTDIGGTVSLAYNNAQFTTREDEAGGRGYHSGLNLKIYSGAQAPIYYDTLNDGLALKYDETQFELDYSGGLKIKDDFIYFKDNSLSLAGSNNFIGTGQNSVVTGQENTCGGSTTIMAGKRNSAAQDTESSLVCGENNSVTSSFNAVTGSNNQCHSISSMVGGANNISYGQNGLLTGESNSVKAKNFIVGGSQNKIEKSQNDTTIACDGLLVQGTGNTVKQETKDVAVVGTNNTVDSKVTTSVLIGEGLSCSSPNQLVVGMYNTPASNAYAFVVGGGVNSDNTNNIFMLDWSGNVHLKRGTNITYDL